jgi:hypothetical protein
VVPVATTAPVVSDKAIKALENTYPYTPRAAELPVDIAAGRLAEVRKLLQGTQEQIQQLKANPPEPSASAAVTAKQQRDWDKNLAKFVQQEARVKEDLVVAQAALDRLAKPVDVVPVAAIEPPAGVKLDPNASPERTARQFGRLNNGKGKWGITEQQWLEAFGRLGGVPDWFDLVGGKANWEKLMQGQEMPELEGRIKALAAPRTRTKPSLRPWSAWALLRSTETQSWLHRYGPGSVVVAWLSSPWATWPLLPSSPRP